MMSTGLEPFLKILYELQKINPEFPIQYAICLSEIAKSEGMSLTDLSEKTGLALSTVSKITTALSKESKKRIHYELVKITVNPSEKRRKQLYLTTHGHRLLKRIENIIQDKG